MAFLAAGREGFETVAIDAHPARVGVRESRRVRTVLRLTGDPHELFLTKAVPQQIPAGLEILWKFVLPWRF